MFGVACGFFFAILLAARTNAADRRRTRFMKNLSHEILGSSRDALSGLKIPSSFFNVLG